MIETITTLRWNWSDMSAYAIECKAVRIGEVAIHITPGIPCHFDIMWTVTYVKSGKAIYNSCNKALALKLARELNSVFKSFDPKIIPTKELRAILEKYYQEKEDEDEFDEQTFKCSEFADERLARYRAKAIARQNSHCEKAVAAIR